MHPDKHFRLLLWPFTLPLGHCKFCIYLYKFSSANSDQSYSSQSNQFCIIAIIPLSSFRSFTHQNIGPGVQFRCVLWKTSARLHSQQCANQCLHADGGPVGLLPTSDIGLLCAHSCGTMVGNWILSSFGSCICQSNSSRSEKVVSCTMHPTVLQWKKVGTWWLTPRSEASDVRSEV